MRLSTRTALAASFIIFGSWVTACGGSDGTGLIGWDGQGHPSQNGNGDDAGNPTGDDGSDSGTAPPPSKDGGTTPPPPGKDSGTTPPPAQDSGTPPPPMDGFDQFQHHNLDVVNMYRATKGIAPLTLDQKLCTFAQAGAVELSQDHMPHQHFINAGNNGTLWTSGFTGGAGENQGDPNGWYVMSQDPTQNELQQIDDIQKAMFNEGPGSGEAHGHYTNMMNGAYKRLGVGLLEVNGKLYLTNDFSD
jgi:Cysteine-rich secretory protein family